MGLAIGGKKIEDNLDAIEDEIRRDPEIGTDPNDGPELENWRAKKDRAFKVIDPD